MVKLIWIADTVNAEKLACHIAVSQAVHAEMISKSKTQFAVWLLTANYRIYYLKTDMTTNVTMYKWFSWLLYYVKGWFHLMNNEWLLTCLCRLNEWIICGRPNSPYLFFLGFMWIDLLLLISCGVCRRTWIRMVHWRRSCSKVSWRCLTRTICLWHTRTWTSKLSLGRHVT